VDFRVQSPLRHALTHSDGTAALRADRCALQRDGQLQGFGAVQVISGRFRSYRGGLLSVRNRIERVCDCFVGTH
jgi:hypothetical protein